MMKLHHYYFFLAFAIVSFAKESNNKNQIHTQHEQQHDTNTNTNSTISALPPSCPNDAQISAFPRHMPFSRHGMYFSSWRLRTYYLHWGATYPGGGTDWQDTPIRIRVTNPNGAPIPGCRVIWRTGRGQSNGWVFPSSSSSSSSITDDDGTTKASWVSGSSPRQLITAAIRRQDGSEASVNITGRAGGERVLAPAPSYHFDYGAVWTAVEFDTRALRWSCGDGGSSVFHTVGSQSGYYTGPQCGGNLFTVWWKSSSEKTDIVAPSEEGFEVLGDRLEFGNETHYCHQCLDCAEGYHASCFLKIPPRVGVVYRQTVMKKLNSWDPASSLTSYVDIGGCGPRGDDATADLAGCPGGEAEVLHHVVDVNDGIVSTIDGCDYRSYTVYSCKNTLLFDPTSTLTSYTDKSSCGPRGDDAQADLTQCPNGASIVKHEPNADWQIVAEVAGCEYFSYTIYKCDENTMQIFPNTDIAVYLETVPDSSSHSTTATTGDDDDNNNDVDNNVISKTLIGEMRYPADKRGHTAGGFLESPSGVRYSCLDTPLMEITHVSGRWRGETGPWRDTDVSMFQFTPNRNDCANVWAGERDDGIHISAGGGLVGPSDGLLNDSCGNGIKDGDEYDVDCGGGCEPCYFEMISCDDGIMNGDEEYVDCGGSCPMSCSDKGNAGSYFKITSSEDNSGEPFTWDEAAELCLSKGSALAIASTTEQNQVLTELCGENIKCWIGLHRRHSCRGPSCLKWTPREDGSIFHLDQTIFNYWGCHGGGGGTGCYFQYKDEYTRYYMYSENQGSKRANAWFAAKESTTATVALCGTPPLSLSSPSPHFFWRVRSKKPWLLDLHFVPFFERDCQTPVLLGDPISYSTSTVTSVESGSSQHIQIHFHDPISIGCFRLDSAESYANNGGVPIMEKVSDGKTFLEYSDDEVKWKKAPITLNHLLSESDARPFHCTENNKDRFFYKKQNKKTVIKSCKWLSKQAMGRIK